MIRGKQKKREGIMKTKITELPDIQYPIFQGGMAWVADGDLAGAVSNAGGLGIIGGGNAPKEVVKANIDKVKSITDRPFGVNIMLLSPLRMTLLTWSSKKCESCHCRSWKSREVWSVSMCRDYSYSCCTECSPC